MTEKKTKINFKKFTRTGLLIAGGFALLGIICIILKASIGSYVDEAGFLHEAFFLLPIGFSLLSIGALLALFVGIRNLIAIVKGTSL